MWLNCTAFQTLQFCFITNLTQLISLEEFNGPSGSREFLCKLRTPQVHSDWCTGRLSLIELYDNGDLNLVPKKIMKKNMRRIPYREVVLIKCWHFYISYKKIKDLRKHSRLHVMTAYICMWYWRRTRQNRCRQGTPFNKAVLFNICWNLIFVKVSENIMQNSRRHWDLYTAHAFTNSR